MLQEHSAALRRAREVRYEESHTLAPQIAETRQKIDELTALESEVLHQRNQQYEQVADASSSPGS